MNFSGGARGALAFALKLASEVGANVACVHAYHDAPETPAFHEHPSDTHRLAA